MTNFQKIIKCGAIAFGTYLSFIIISVIIFTLAGIFGVFIGVDYLNGKVTTSQQLRTIDFEEQYENDKVKELEMDLSTCNVTIQDGENFKVEASHVPDNFSSQLEGNTLKVKEKSIHFSSLGETSHITITIPEDQELAKIELKMGVNKTIVESIQAKEFKIQTGVGVCRIENLIAEKAKIEGGAGELIVENGQIGELKANSGIGKFSMTAKITKQAKYEAGVGEVQVTLLGNEKDYEILAQKGLGNLQIDGKTFSGNEKTIGSGNVPVKISAGIGKVSVYFEEESI